MLLLFDIDGTLYSGGGSGWAAFGDAGRDIFGEAFTNEGVVYSGWLDPLIFAALAERNGGSTDADTLARFRERAHHHLKRRIASGEFPARALPGGIDLVEALHARTDAVTLGLLTGNWPENGRLKLETVGYAMDRFRICAWGSDGATRPDLVPAAWRRYCQEVMENAIAGVTGHAPETATSVAGDPPGEAGTLLRTAGLDHGRILGDRVLVIGDTRHDVACAKAHDCLCLGVTTGGGTAEELHAAGADRVVDDLTDTRDLVAWILDLARREDTTGR